MYFFFKHYESDFQSKRHNSKEFVHELYDESDINSLFFQDTQSHIGSHLAAGWHHQTITITYISNDAIDKVTIGCKWKLGEGFIDSVDF